SLSAAASFRHQSLGASPLRRNGTRLRQVGWRHAWKLTTSRSGPGPRLLAC
ncbi:hypothetical protein MNEG_13891, partial [Monoraphidium neglectum]